MSDAADDPAVKVEQYALDHCWVVSVTGELDAHSLSPVSEAVELAAASHPVLVLDTGGVTFADSTVLSLLLTLHAVTKLRIAAPSPQIVRLLAITRADEVLSVFSTLEQACEIAA
ncbi:STAS domain-containing protein [Streptomyces sp. NPDC059759]|uniref:STAS domain-containing protein n=1 Tax=Streptomyces sp. NPDC059759 TaxID=3346936 RepID=UPI00365D629F